MFRILGVHASVRMDDNDCQQSGRGSLSHTQTETRHRRHIPPRTRTQLTGISKAGRGVPWSLERQVGSLKHKVRKEFASTLKSHCD